MTLKDAKRNLVANYWQMVTHPQAELEPETEQIILDAVQQVSYLHLGLPFNAFSFFVRSTCVIMPALIFAWVVTGFPNFWT